MAYVPLTEANFAIDAAATSQDMLELINNQKAVKEFPKEIFFGGDPNFQYVNTAYQSLISPVYKEIDGTNLVGLTLELRFMGLCTSGDTLYAQLWDRTALAQIVEKSASPTTLALVKSATFVLPVATREFEVRVKATLGGIARPFKVYQCSLVQR